MVNSNNPHPLEGVFAEALALLEAGCQHFSEALRSERRALEARDAEKLIIASKRKLEAARQLERAQGVASETALAQKYDATMAGFLALALDYFEEDSSLRQRFHEMLKLLGHCAQVNETARRIVEARLECTDEALRLLHGMESRTDPRYGQDGRPLKPGAGAHRGVG
jgi:flagellar biosynthesis/type III secretory pathway chaperone